VAIDLANINPKNFLEASFSRSVSFTYIGTKEIVRKPFFEIVEIRNDISTGFYNNLPTEIFKIYPATLYIDR
jgi:hypothetical protein